VVTLLFILLLTPAVLCSYPGDALLLDRPRQDASAASELLSKVR